MQKRRRSPSNKKTRSPSPPFLCPYPLKNNKKTPNDPFFGRNCNAVHFFVVLGEIYCYPLIYFESIATCDSDDHHCSLTTSLILHLQRSPPRLRSPPTPLLTLPPPSLLFFALVFKRIEVRRRTPRQQANRL